MLLAVSGLAVASTSTASADTTSARTWIEGGNTFYAYTAAGETLDVNFSPFNIKTVDANFEGGGQQARNDVRPGITVNVTAPDGTVSTCDIANGAKVADVNAFDGDATNLPAAHGVNVCDWGDLSSSTAGVWQIDITRGDTGETKTAIKWDITAKSAGTAVNGRVWADRYAGTSYGRGGVDGQGWTAGMFDLSLWFVGENGYIYGATYKDFNGYGYAIESDSFGVTKSAMSCESAYKSTPTSGIVTGRPDSADSVKVLAENGEAYGLSNGRCGPAYHIFFAQPAADLPTSAQLADGTTVFVKPDIETPEIASLSYTPTAEGSFAGTFAGTAVNFTGNVELLVDVDNDGVNDLTLPGVVDQEGNLTANWDGRDGDGNPVPVTNQVKVSAQVSKRGEIHFVRDDVEYSGGIEVTRLNGNAPGPVALNWDDTLLAGGLSGTEDGANRLCSTNPLVSEGATGNVHAWSTACPPAGLPGHESPNSNNGTTGFWGDARWIDDWTYETYELPPYVIQLGPLPTVKVIKDVESRVVGSEDQFTVGVRTADDTELASATTTGTETAAETVVQGVLPDKTYTIFDTTTSGSNPITGYDATVQCLVGDETVTATAGDTVGTWTIDTPESQVYIVAGPNATPIAPYNVVCTITNAAKDAPTADPATVTVDQGETATLNPTVTPGEGDITEASFDNGETTKVVPGEGTWAISVDDDGKVVATFTPEDGFTGPVTQQAYTVTDENGLTASSTLDVVIRPSAGDDSATINPNETATLTPEVTPGSSPVTEVTFDNGETTKVVEGEGSWSISVDDEGKVVATFTPEADYHGPVTPQEYTVTDENGETASGTLSVEINDPPVAGDDSVTIDPNETATLNPEVTPGDGAITDVTFDDGSTEKVVPGEGTWTIELDEGKVVATFTPEADYDGPVTPQAYTVTDENGLTASGQLSVTITEASVPPQAGDDSVRINPNETATLNPEVTPGDGAITDVTFDNGETTKVVEGEGTWKIELVDGKVVATFTPEADYDGPVTPQEYTVTDENGESAKGQLLVAINEPPAAGDDSVVIDPNETATLNPEVLPGTGAITDVTFDNGETTKVVEGEGTWKIELVDGKVVATFTPEADYDGPVTPQEYTVTDENGLTDSGALSVAINAPSTPAPAPGLSLVKTASVEDVNGNGINDVGDVIVWSFAVTNTGNVALENVAIDDAKLAELGIEVTCESTSLAAGASLDCESGEYTITEADVAAGSVKNVATATGEVPEGTPGDPEDPTSPPSEVEVPTKPTPTDPEPTPTPTPTEPTPTPTDPTPTPTDPTPTPTDPTPTEPTPTPTKPGLPSTGSAAADGLIGGSLVLLVLGAAMMIVVRRRARKPEVTWLFGEDTAE